MSEQQWRLLNEGETIREGDEAYCARAAGEEHEKWKKALPWIGYKVSPKFVPYRRRLETGWVALSERRPTDGHVIWVDNEGVIWWTDYAGRGGVLPAGNYNSATHWRAMEVPPQPDPFEQWFNGAAKCIPTFKEAFNAGRDYEKQQREPR